MKLNTSLSDEINISLVDWFFSCFVLMITHITSELIIKLTVPIKTKCINKIFRIWDGTEVTESKIDMHAIVDGVVEIFR